VLDQASQVDENELAETGEVSAGYPLARALTRHN
jgi:hypothetical protein